MCRRLAGLQDHAAELDRVAGFQRRECVFGLCLRAEVDRRAGLVAKLEVPRQKIRVQVGEDDTTDLEAVRLCFLEILPHVALRIDDGSGSGHAVADKIRRVREATEIELLEDQH